MRRRLVKPAWRLPILRRLVLVAVRPLRPLLLVGATHAGALLWCRSAHAFREQAPNRPCSCGPVTAIPTLLLLLLLAVAATKARLWPITQEPALPVWRAPVLLLLPWQRLAIALRPAGLSPHAAPSRASGVVLWRGQLLPLLRPVLLLWRPLGSLVPVRRWSFVHASHCSLLLKSLIKDRHWRLAMLLQPAW